MAYPVPTASIPAWDSTTAGYDWASIYYSPEPPANRPAPPAPSALEQMYAYYSG